MEAVRRARQGEKNTTREGGGAQLDPSRRGLERPGGDRRGISPGSVEKGAQQQPTELGKGFKARWGQLRETYSKRGLKKKAKTNRGGGRTGRRQSGEQRHSAGKCEVSKPVDRSPSGETRK